ncbi:MAG: DUF4142 domain-containing protein [Acetobacteraceae bacterium]|nr:DUF4142 domain-containing protein [Acetobacteraceae bacterium]
MIRTFGAACLLSTALSLTPALAQTSNSGANNNTQEFVTKAAVGNMFEIQSSQLALKKSQEQDIKTFAQKMIDDHTAVENKMKSLAKNENIPNSLDQQHEQMLKTLENDSGNNFGTQYKQMQVSAHQQTIDLFKNYAQHGSDQQIKQFAEQTLPTLQQHLQMAQNLTPSNGAGNNQAANQSGGANAVNAGFMTQQQADTWRASKVIGLSVYNEQNQKVGDIDDVLLNRSGKADAVVVGVGGFLGIGERDVAVPYDQLKWSMTPVNAGANSSTGNNGATNNAANTPAPAGSPATTVPPVSTASSGGTTPVTTTGASSSAQANNNNQPPAYPDHAVLANASKDQLQNAPQFHYGSAPR